MGASAADAEAAPDADRSVRRRRGVAGGAAGVFEAAAFFADGFGGAGFGGAGLRAAVLFAALAAVPAPLAPFVD
jgi:hypothetical protein